METTEKKTEGIATSLNVLLADEYMVYTKTRNACWNIDGQTFKDLNTFFQIQYEELFYMIDEIGERIRMLGHYAIGSLKDFLEFTHLPEEKHHYTDQKNRLSALISDHESIIRVIQNDIVPITERHQDMATINFVTGIRQQNEKMARMLRAYIE